MKLRIMAFILMTLLLFASCEAERTDASLRVELDKGTRTLSPEARELEIYGYRIIPVGPDGKERDARYTYYSYINMDNLTPGDWTIKAYGFNRDRKDLAYGEKRVSLISGKNAVSLSVRELIGEGSLSLKMTWDDRAFPLVKEVNVSLLNQDGEEFTALPSTPSDGFSILSLPSLPAGSYSLQAWLKGENGEVLSGFAEAIRIANGTNAAFEAKFRSSPDEKIDDEEKRTSSLSSAIPLEAKINGITNLMEANAPIRANLTVLSPSVELKDIDVEWFLDGEKISQEKTLVLENGTAEGMRRIDAIFRTEDSGSVGSASVSFLSAASTLPGAIYQTIELEDGEAFALGEKTVARFLPDNRLIAASNSERCVSIIDVSSARPVVEKSYTYDGLGLSGTVADFGTYGKEDDKLFSLLFLCNEETQCKAVNVIITGTNMTKTDEASSFDPKGAVGEKCVRFTSVVPSAKTLLASMESNDKTRVGLVYFNLNPKKGEMVNRADMFYNGVNEFGYTGIKRGYSVLDLGLAIFASGERSKIMKSKITADGIASITEGIMWVSAEDYMSYYERGIVKPEFMDGKDCGFLDQSGDYAFVFSTEGIYYFKKDSNTTYIRYAVQDLSGRDITDVRMAPDAECGYMIDRGNKRITTMEPVWNDEVGGYLLEEGDWISFDDKRADEITISISGSYAAAYDQSQGRKITVMKIAR